MAITRPNRTIPVPRRARPRPHRPVIMSGGASGASAFVQESGTWNFAVRVWIAFDPPTVAAPAWIPITSWVETGVAITIRHGRADGMADVNATTCTLTVDNSDGRFNAANPSGVFFGLIHKGNWLKVEVLPPSGVVDQRFVGFITTLPTAWQGLYATTQITASDRFEKLGNAPSLVSSIQSEVLTDPNLAGNVKSYWNLHEASSTVYGRMTFGDTSGNLAAPLVANVAGGVPAGTGLGVANVAGPGFDGLRAATFNPPTTGQGTYLTGTVAMPPANWDPVGFQFTGLDGVLEFWFQATTTATQQYLASVVDPVAQFAVTLWVDTAGQLNVSTVPTAAANTAASSTFQFPPGYLNPRVDDGQWHHIVLSVQSTTASGGWTNFGIVQDGLTPGGYTGVTGCSGNNLSQLIIGAGYNASRTLILGSFNVSDVAWTWAPLMAPNILVTPSAAGPFLPDYISHAAAGRTGFLGESTDKRVARIARYAGIPIPLTVGSWLANYAGGLGSTLTYNPVKGAWTNLSAGAHSCGTQSVSGRKPADVMREAARTEAMPLYFDGSGYLALQPSTTRQNTTPAWTVAAADLDPQTVMPDDFAYTVNQITVTPNGQAAQTVIGAVGAASQLKHGIYDKSQATASLNAVEAGSLGAQFIQLGADPPPRLAPLVIEVATLATRLGPAFYDAILASEISTAARVTGLPTAAGGGNYDFLIEGWTETIVAGFHRFAFNTSPAQGPTYALDDPVLGRADTDGSMLSGSTLNTTGLSFQVATTTAGSPLWVTDPAQFPLDVGIDGEQITLSGISGASSPQTFTASARSVNGVVSAHNPGAAVSVWQPLTLAY